MNNYFTRTGLTFIFFYLLLNLIGCGLKPEPEPLPISVQSNLNLLQDNPQFVMYLNFNNMRRTEFWAKNISDSLLNAEKTFGSLLNTFKMATGASISNGIDELYYSNSWFGENSIVLKGIFDKKKLEEYLLTDSIFSLTKNADGKNIYIKNDNGLYFYFRDDFTICASNYLKQIDIMIQTKDTAQAGLLKNQKIFDAISEIIYKKDLWMVSTEKTFIKGIFRNFIESTSDANISGSDSPDFQNQETPDDTVDLNEKLTVENLYKHLEAVSFSADMGKSLKFLVQGECINPESSKYLRSMINGLLTVARLSNSGKKKSPERKILNNIKLERYDNSVFIELNVDDVILKELKNTNLMSEPEQ